MVSGQEPNTVKLDDAQISRFICDGILLLDSAVDSNLHGTIRKKLEWVNKNDRSIEGNIIPRIPEVSDDLAEALYHMGWHAAWHAAHIRGEKELSPAHLPILSRLCFPPSGR